MLVVFDCDGTLIDSQANIIRAMTNAFTNAALPPPDANRIRAIVGLSLQEAMQALAPEVSTAQRAQLTEDYKNGFQRLRADGDLAHEPLYPGILELLQRLKKEQYTLGIATGKSTYGLQRALAHHALSDYFSTLQTADQHPSKPHPAMLQRAMYETNHTPQETVMIGDTSYDIEMGRSAQAIALGVTWGYHAPPLLEQAGAHAICSDCPSLYERIQKFLS